MLVPCWHFADVSAAAPPPNVAYLFSLRRASHPLHRPWNQFWRSCGHDTPFRVFCHTDPDLDPRRSDTPSIPASAPIVMQGSFAGSVIPEQVKIRRFGWTMVEARLLLLQHALQAAPDADFFVFLSETDAPIADCSLLLRYLSHRAGGSFMQSGKPFGAGGGGEPRVTVPSEAKFSRVCPRCRDANISITDYRHGPGWVALWRSHAQRYVELAPTVGSLFKEEGGPPGIPDETFWTTLAAHHGFHLWDHLLTHMAPGSAKTGHPHLFMPEEIAALKPLPLAHQPKFFVRKIYLSGNGTLAKSESELSRLLEASSRSAQRTIS